ncbi:MAG: hypothetical protein PHR55_01180 [Bacilli bacterium]|nr:hypothetical protein [Bacilli bacterium]
MLETALEVLNIIERHKFECYLVGGFVRDFYLCIESKDVDICTNAKSKDLLELFPSAKIPKELYGAVTLFFKDVRFEITTFRKEIKYENRKPIEIEYTNSFIEDVKRRDFTINSLCMNSKGEIIDLLNGKEDIDKKIIRCINDPNVSLKEDPLRILRAIRFSAQLDFELDKNLYKGIKQNKKYLDILSYNRIKSEINKILASKNVKKGIDLIRKLSLNKQLKLYDLNKLSYINDIIGYWAQIDKENVYEYTSIEKKNIKQIREIMKTKKITNFELYNYGLYICLLGAQILNIDKEKIINMYKELPVKSKNEINITAEEISTLLKKDLGSWLKPIYDDLTNKILNKKIENDNEILKKYIKDKYMI